MFTRKSTGLVREVSLFDAFVWNSAASSFLGLTVFTIWDLSWLPGAGFVQAELIALFFAVAIGLSFAFLTSSMPRAGGDYVFNSRILHPAIGFAANFSLSVWELVAAAFVVYFVSFSGLGPGLQVLGYLLGNVGLTNVGLSLSQPLNAFIIGTLINIVFTIVALLGLARVAKFLDVLWIVSIIGIVALISVLLLTHQTEFVSRFDQFIHASGGSLSKVETPYGQVVSQASTSGFSLAPQSLVGPEIAVVAGSVIWVFWSTYIGGEIKRIDNLRRNVISMVGAAVLNAFLFLLILYGMLRSFGYDFLASLSFIARAQPNVLPLGSPAGIMILLSGLASGSVWIAGLIMIAFSIRALLFLPSLILQPVRSMFAWSMDRILPDRLSQVNEKLHVPILLHIIAAVVVEGFLVFLVLYPEYLFPIFASAIIAPAFSAIFPTAISATLFPFRRKEMYLNSPARLTVMGIPAISITGVASAGFMLFLVYEFLAWPGFGLRDPFLVLMNFGMIPLGLILYKIASVIRKRQGIDFANLFSQIPPE
ncbi:MAG TPA: amino acid permease [Candidatus Bathyarchaeia archaeon]|nr:amino acid permease [Candidatus Bathyarchaeia archaeon]